MSNKSTPTEQQQQRQQAMTRALQQWDPEAEVTLDHDTGRVTILTILPDERVVDILEEAGEHAELDASPKDHGGTTCCGGCSQ